MGLAFFFFLALIVNSRALKITYGNRGFYKGRPQMCDSDNITWGIWIRPGKQYVYQSLLVHLFSKNF